MARRTVNPELGRFIVRIHGKDQLALAMTGRKSFLTPPADHSSRLLDRIAILEQIFNQPELGEFMPPPEQHESVRS